MTEQLVKTFRAVDFGNGTDGRWAASARELLRERNPEAWLTDEGRTPRGAARARALFAEHLPELVPIHERLAAQIPELPLAGTILTHAAFRPFFAGCTQTGRPGRLLRNYDFAPRDCDGVIARSDFLRPVIGMQEGVWGLLDGMNDAGLAVSLTFGGRMVAGPGLSMPLVLRSVLETCGTVDEAVERMRAIPFAIAQNVTLADARTAVTVQVGPDIPLTVADDFGACAANHQTTEPVPAEQEEATRTQARLAAIRAAGPEADVSTMLRPPLYQHAYADGLGTVYTADYRPTEGRVSYHWPATPPCHQSFTSFNEATFTVALTPR